MINPTTASGARLFTVFGTVLFVDDASGELRHGAIESSPPNAFFEAEKNQAGVHCQGWLVYASGDSRDTIVCTAAYHKGTNPHDIAAAARRVNPAAEIHVAADIADAVRRAGELAVSRQRKIYVAGGLFLAIEYATAARGGRPQDLEFL